MQFLRKFAAKELNIDGWILLCEECIGTAMLTPLILVIDSFRNK